MIHAATTAIKIVPTYDARCQRKRTRAGRRLTDLAVVRTAILGPELVTGNGFDLSRRRRDHVSELVGETREDTTEGDGRELGDYVGAKGSVQGRVAQTGTRRLTVDRDNTPGALDTELDEEGTGGKTTEAVREEPEREEGAGPQAEDDDGEATAEELANVAGHRAASNLLDHKEWSERRAAARDRLDTYSAAVADDGREGGVVSRETLRLLDVRRVDVLRTVREEAAQGKVERVSLRRSRADRDSDVLESSHQANREDSPDPVKLECAPGLLHEDLALLRRADGDAALLLGRAAVDEDLRLGEDDPEQSGKSAYCRGEIEEDPPVAGPGNLSEIDAGGEEVADRVTLLLGRKMVSGVKLR